MAATRNTVQKEIVSKTINSMYNHPTVDMLYEKIREEYGNISKATVYRILNQLVQQNEIQCVKVPNAADRFDCRREEHDHIRCIRCGQIMDISLPIGEELTQKAQEAVDFQIVGHHTIFDGICNRCY